jgi:Zn-dependent alcohol dehydrogenase
VRMLQWNEQSACAWCPPFVSPLCVRACRYMSGGLKLDEYITHHFKLPEINDAFHLLHEGKTLRAMIHM